MDSLLRHGDLVEYPRTPGDYGTIIDEGALIVIWHECLQRPWPEEGGCHVDHVEPDGEWEYGEVGERLRLVKRDANALLGEQRVQRARGALHATMRACEGDEDDESTINARAEAELAWLALEGVQP